AGSVPNIDSSSLPRPTLASTTIEACTRLSRPRNPRPASSPSGPTSGGRTPTPTEPPSRSTATSASATAPASPSAREGTDDLRRIFPILLLTLAGSLAAQGPTIDPRNLTALASPADGDVIPIWPIAGGQAKKATWGGLRSGFLTAVGTYTPASGGLAPIRWLTTGSTATGATNEG